MAAIFVVKASGLNLRSAPKLDSANVVAVLQQGQRVIVLDQSLSDWWQVEAELAGQTKQGFVNSRFLQAIADSDTLKDLIDSEVELSFTQLNNKPRLVLELQHRLRNLGFYPGGQWLDSQLGSQTSMTWKGWQQFCKDSGLPAPTATKAINGQMAKSILETRSVPRIFKQASNLKAVRKQLADIHQRTPRNSPYPPFSDRTIKNSPFEDDIQRYPASLAAMHPDGNTTISHGRSITLAGDAGGSVTFNDFPLCGVVPAIDTGKLSFLPSSIANASICVGSFVPGVDQIKVHWLGKNPLEEKQYWSSTKFIAPLEILCRLGKINPSIDIDDCEVGFDETNQRSRTHNFNRLIEHMVSYEEKKIAPSNAIAATFKRFSTREALDEWLISMTGNSGLQFKGYYSREGAFIRNPVLIDKNLGRNEVVMRNAPETGGQGKSNLVSSYDMVRIISMLGWHLHLQDPAKLPGAQWTCLESVVRAMGFDPARYVDIAFETLGVVDHIANPVVISKLGSGYSSERVVQEDTCVAFVSFVDTRTSPGRLHMLSFALHAGGSTAEAHDVDLAVAVTEIIRRTMALELA